MFCRIVNQSPASPVNLPAEASMVACTVVAAEVDSLEACMAVEVTEEVVKMLVDSSSSTMFVLSQALSHC